MQKSIAFIAGTLIIVLRSIINRGYFSKIVQTLKSNYGIRGCNSLMSLEAPPTPIWEIGVSILVSK